MMTIQLTRRVSFCAAHRYARAEWDDQRNREVFGACSNPHGHGHNYRLDVTVQAPVDAVTGFSIDLRLLDVLLDEEVVRLLDHQHLNHAVAEFGEGGVVPTCENILLWLWPRLSRRLPEAATLHRLRLYENDDLFVDCFSDSGT
jgi:6-pyruvoyltetrahydropterin/6-carboxytetrahydropterin synthase